MINENMVSFSVAQSANSGKCDADKEVKASYLTSVDPDKVRVIVCQLVSIHLVATHLTFCSCSLSMSAGCVACSELQRLTPLAGLQSADTMLGACLFIKEKSSSGTTTRS